MVSLVGQKQRRVGQGLLLSPKPQILSALCGAQVPTKCSGVPESILNPANQWADKAEFDSTLHHLADLYEVRCNQYPSTPCQPCC